MWRTITLELACYGAFVLRIKVSEHVKLIKLLKTTGVFSQFEFSVLQYIGVNKLTKKAIPMINLKRFGR